MDRHFGVLTAASIALMRGHQPGHSNGCLRWGWKAPHPESGPPGAAPNPPCQGPCLGLPSYPGPLWGPWSPRAQGSCPGSLRTGVRAARGAGAPHGLQSGLGVQWEWGHHHLQGCRGWRGAASPARLLFTVIHLGQLKPLFGRHNTQFPQLSSFSSSILLSRVVRASCPSESPCPHPEARLPPLCPLGGCRREPGPERNSSQVDRQAGPPDPGAHTEGRPAPSCLSAKRPGSECGRGCVRLAAASAGPPELMEI